MTSLQAIVTQVPAVRSLAEEHGLLTGGHMDPLWGTLANTEETHATFSFQENDQLEPRLMKLLVWLERPYRTIALCSPGPIWIVAQWLYANQVRYLHVCGAGAADPRAIRYLRELLREMGYDRKPAAPAGGRMKARVRSRC